MLKLIYNTSVFGPIDLDFEKPVITVGSAPGNDLVLDHPSILPHQCQLVFRGEKLLVTPPGPLPLDHSLWLLKGRELGIGEILNIGDLEFELDHSSRTVAVHVGSASLTEPVADAGEVARHYCPKCQKHVAPADVKLVGLVGQAKRELCPRCSGELLHAAMHISTPSG